ncbi:unnamed protein product [Amaranthus hypochondriacus]
MADKKVNPISNALGLLRVRVKRGINLAVRDVKTSDPYVILRLGKQKLKTRVIKKSLNPEWNEDLTLCVTDPNEPIKLVSTQLLRLYEFASFYLRRILFLKGK